MSKLIVTLLCFMIAALLLFSSLTYAARPQPAHPNHSPIPMTRATQHEHGGDQHITDEIEEDEGEELGLGGDQMISCEGVGEEECLMMRRTLVAHTDYIYTQKKKKP